MIGDGNPLYDIKPRRRYGFGTQRTKEREERRSCFFRFLFPGSLGNTNCRGEVFRATVQSGIAGLPGRGVPAGRRIWLNAGGRGWVRDMRPDDRQESDNGDDRDDADNAENADNAHEAKTEYEKLRGGRAGRKISGRNGKRADAVSVRLSVCAADKGRRQAGRKGNEASKRRWRGKRSKGRKKRGGERR